MISTKQEKSRTYEMEDNDSITVSDQNSYKVAEKVMGYTQTQRTFNFSSGQITTKTVDVIHCSYDYSVPALSTAMQIQNFSDVQSTKEIEFMHAKLEMLGGKPPALADVLEPIRIQKIRAV